MIGHHSVLVSSIGANATMEGENVRTPTKTPHSRSRSVLGEISFSGTRFNVPSPIPSEKYKATATAANRLIDFNRRIPQNTTNRSSLSTDPGSQHRRRLSKASRHQFRQRAAPADGESTSDSDSSGATDTCLNLGDSENPIIHFRPHLWRHLERTRDTLNLDLFWPQKLGNEVGIEEDDDNEDNPVDGKIFPVKGLLPLCEFRNLRSLRIGGMLQSYQVEIWRTCWLNPGLEELVLEMALEPSINRSNQFCTPIEEPWRRKTISEARTEYL
jgi:hypothetical protein